MENYTMTQLIYYDLWVLHAVGEFGEVFFITVRLTQSPQQQLCQWVAEVQLQPPQSLQLFQY